MHEIIQNLTFKVAFCSLAASILHNYNIRIKIPIFVWKLFKLRQQPHYMAADDFKSLLQWKISRIQPLSHTVHTLWRLEYSIPLSHTVHTLRRLECEEVGLGVGIKTVESKNRAELDKNKNKKNRVDQKVNFGPRIELNQLEPVSISILTYKRID